ncbi:hypothetical protein AC1031_005150 [Aphanomyces cochlioides]|nr:hypothetical protein AC1031_005150 [Aphanomyces cochlioides]
MAPFWPTTKLEDFIVAAIASKNLQGAIECLAYLALSAIDVFLGIGHAVMWGNVAIAKFLASQLEHDTSNATRCASSIQRGLLTETLQTSFQSIHVDSLPWLLDVWAQYLPPSWTARCRRECRHLAVENLRWDVLETLTSRERKRFDNYQLQRARHAFQLYHVVEATKAWHPKEPKSAEILQRLVWRWLYNAETTEKQRGIVRCMKVALKQHGLGIRAMQILWSTQVIPYTQEEFTIPQPQSIQEFTALDLLPSECYETYRPHITTRLRVDYIRATRQVACATDANGNRLYKQPVAIRAVHRPGDKLKYVVDA